MAVSGRRMRWWPANAIAAVVIAWSVFDIATTAPDLAAHDAGARSRSGPSPSAPRALVGIALVVLMTVLALGRIGDLSLEHALRRAGLVAQLRFAVTLQDVRTVVLLRRQLSQENPRPTPWVRIGRAQAAQPRPPGLEARLAELPAVPVATTGRAWCTLGVIAGLSLGLMWRGTIPMVVVAGVALYLAAYDAAEPTAQEVDHPTRWESYPDDPGRLLAPAPGRGVHGDGHRVPVRRRRRPRPRPLHRRLEAVPRADRARGDGLGGRRPPSAPPRALPTSPGLAGLGPDMMGWVMLARVVIPPAITIVALLPLLGAGSDPAQIQTNRVGNATVYTLFLVVGVRPLPPHTEAEAPVTSPFALPKQPPTPATEPRLDATLRAADPRPEQGLRRRHGPRHRARPQDRPRRAGHARRPQRRREVHLARPGRRGCSSPPTAGRSSAATRRHPRGPGRPVVPARRPGALRRPLPGRAHRVRRPAAPDPGVGGVRRRPGRHVRPRPTASTTSRPASAAASSRRPASSSGSSGPSG